MTINGFSQDSLIREVPVNKASYFTTDNSGNIYVVGNQNYLQKFNSKGILLAHFNNIQNGPITRIDSKNPLRLLVFYQQFSKILLLDNQLSVLFDLDLKQLGLFAVQACGMSDDGYIWVYDELKSELIKIDNQLNIITNSNDLRTETGVVLSPTALKANSKFVYLADSTNGIFVFDRYGGYLNTLPIYGVKDFQLINNQIIWMNKGLLHRYDLQTFDQKEIKLPAGVLEAKAGRDGIYLLTPKGINIFYSPQK